jgi:acyl-CoA dehydrogenase
MPLERMYRAARSARLVDGADEVHKATLARNLLKGYAPVEVPTEHRPTRAKHAQQKFAEYLDTMAVNA